MQRSNPNLLFLFFYVENFDCWVLMLGDEMNEEFGTHTNLELKFMWEEENKNGGTIYFTAVETTLGSHLVSGRVKK